MLSASDKGNNQAILSFGSARKHSGLMLEEIFHERLHTILGLTHDLVETLDDQHLLLRIPHARSNSLGGQIFCIVGARESYLKGMSFGAW